jgi:hypothetical protein
MNKIILTFINIYKIFIFIALLAFNSALYAQDKSNFKHVEATGRSILLPENIETSRKRALEDAIYLAALKGGANVNGFSAISSNTIINEQSVIKATNRVLDFKILSETQNKEYLTIKIRAVVGNELSKQNCNIRPININLFKGSITVDTNVPSELARYTSLWYNKTYEYISKLPNVDINNFQNRQLNQIIKSSQNSSFNYNAITKGIPIIHPGNYSLVPKIVLTKTNKNSFANYLLTISFDLYKGQKIKLETSKSYNLLINYQLESKFQFLKNISTLDLDKINQNVNNHLSKVINSFFYDINCMPLEGKLTLSEGKLQVDLGSRQGLKQKQIGLVNGIKIQNSMLNDSILIVHTEDVFDNYSTLLPLNDNVKLTNLNDKIVKFVE